MDLMTSESIILRDKDDVKIENDKEDSTQARIRNDKNSKSVSKKSEEFFVKYRAQNYEISDLLKNHPGGRGTICAFRGLTLDKVFNEVPHSDAAFHLFEEFIVNNQRDYDNIENLVDWSQPMLGQVGKLADRYWEWVNLPVNRSVRLFQSDFLERLTITSWYIIPMVWIPISFYFIYLGFIVNRFTNIENSLPVILLGVSCGILLWTFIEYVLHRYLFHLKPPSNSKTIITLHFLLHGLHHKAPFDDQRLVFPPAAAILVATIFYYLYRAVLPDVIVYFVGAGTMTGYLCYDLIHYYLHHGSPKADTYLYVMKRYHNRHHFSHHNQGFGISSRLWDFVFGTLIRLAQLKKAIVW